MKKIPLSKRKYSGLFALVDNEDYEFLTQWNWSVIYPHRKNGGYAVRVEYGESILMHRLIMSATEGVEVRHRNRNGLDNRRENLKVIDKTNSIPTGLSPIP